MDYNKPRRGNAVYVDRKGRKMISGHNVQLFTPHEWSILSSLWGAMPRAAKREDLIRAIWGEFEAGRTTRTVETRSMGSATVTYPVAKNSSSKTIERS